MGRMDWRVYWQNFPRRFGDREFCQQVGRTAGGGVPTAEPELARVLEQVVRGLDLGSADRVLDLCCGNGLLTRRLAEHCMAIVGVDFSDPMIDLARRYHSATNAQYLCASALELEPGLFAGFDPFDKVTMFESLQYFTPAELPDLLAGIARVTSRRATAYFSGILDEEGIWRFFDTPERRASYESQRRDGREIMGHWWRRADIDLAARESGFTVDFRDQEADLNTAHYRFDARLERR